MPTPNTKRAPPKKEPDEPLRPAPENLYAALVWVRRGYNRHRRLAIVRRDEGAATIEVRYWSHSASAWRAPAVIPRDLVIGQCIPGNPPDYSVQRALSFADAEVRDLLLTRKAAP